MSSSRNAGIKWAIQLQSLSFKDEAAWTEELSVFNLSLSSVIDSLESRTWSLLLQTHAKAVFITISRFYLLPFLRSPSIPPNLSLRSSLPLSAFL